jgi:UbiD family decarboxylase
MIKDLRSFIAQIESEHPEEIARVTKPISPRYEITALLTRLEKSKRFPLLFCEGVNGSNAPVVINVQASRKLMAFALECRPDELAAAFSARQNRPIAPVELSAASVHEVLRLGDEVDLTQVPLLTHYDVNAAPYITAGIVVAADPDTGVRNTSYNRLMLAGKRELRIFMAVGRHLWTLHNKAERRGEPLPIAIIVGPPMTSTRSSAA